MELFARPIYLFYFLPAAAATALVFWAGRKLKQRAVNALFGPAAYAKLTEHLRPARAWRTAMCSFTKIMVKIIRVHMHRLFHSGFFGNNS